MKKIFIAIIYLTSFIPCLLSPIEPFEGRLAELAPYLIRGAGLYPAAAFAVEVAPKISDREIIEKLSALDAKIEKVHSALDAKIDREIANVRGDISALDAKIDREIANVRGDIKEIRADIRGIQQQIADLRDFMLWGFGILFAGMFTLVGFVLWDRRTALSPAIRKNKELEEREEKLEKALKEYSIKEPRLAEILRNVGIM